MLRRLCAAPFPLEKGFKVPPCASSLRKTRDASQCSSPDDMHSDHQQITARRVVGGNCKGSGSWKQPQIIASLEEQTKPDALYSVAVEIFHSPLHRVRRLRHRSRSARAVSPQARFRVHLTRGADFARQLRRDLAWRERITFRGGSRRCHRIIATVIGPVATTPALNDQRRAKSFPFVIPCSRSPLECRAPTTFTKQKSSGN